MAANTWLSCPAEQQIMFETPVKDRWQAAADLIGVDLSLMSSDTGHA
jgi:putative transcriptional regulator